MTTQVETVKQEAARLGISISEVRRRRNFEAPRKEVLRLEDGGTYRNGFGELIKVRKLQPNEVNQHAERVKTFKGVDNHARYTDHGIYDAVNGPLAKFNLIEKV